MRERFLTLWVTMWSPRLVTVRMIAAPVAAAAPARSASPDLAHVRVAPAGAVRSSRVGPLAFLREKIRQLINVRRVTLFGVFLNIAGMFCWYSPIGLFLSSSIGCLAPSHLWPGTNAGGITTSFCFGGFKFMPPIFWKCQNYSMLILWSLQRLIDIN